MMKLHVRQALKSRQTSRTRGSYVAGLDAVAQSLRITAIQPTEWCHVKRLCPILSVIFVLVMLSMGELNAKVDDYLLEAPVRRIALVAGNSEYQNGDPLPGSLEDASRIKELLESLGFDVAPVSNFKTRADFLSLHFLPFLEKLQEGDFVVFYFSGHGFSYAGESYLTPLSYPTRIPESKLLRTFIGETAIRSMILDRKPAFFLSVLDACRNIGSIVVRDQRGGSNEVTKGLSRLQSSPENLMVAFSSAPGEISIGSTDGELSYFTAGLVKHLDDVDVELDRTRKHISIFVRRKTNDAQVPWFTTQNTSLVWFNPSQAIQKMQRKAWISALTDGTQDAVETFLMLYGLSDYAQAARQWLKDFSERAPPSMTRIAPLGPEIAWDIANAQAPDRPLEIARVVGPLGMARSVNINSLDLPEGYAPENLSKIVLVGKEKPAVQLSRMTAEILAAHREAITLTDTKVREGPSEDAAVLDVIPFWQRVRVAGLKVGEDGRAWSQVALKDQGRLGYIAMPELNAPITFNLGMPLAELYLSPESGDSKCGDRCTLLNENTIKEAIHQIRSAGKEITWISIATGRVDDNRVRPILRSQASHAVLIATQAGVPRGMITTVEGTDFEQIQVRMRIFGE